MNIAKGEEQLDRRTWVGLEVGTRLLESEALTPKGKGMEFRAEWRLTNSCQSVVPETRGLGTWQ